MESNLTFLSSGLDDLLDGRISRMKLSPPTQLGDIGSILDDADQVLHHIQKHRSAMAEYRNDVGKKWI